MNCYYDYFPLKMIIIIVDMINFANNQIKNYSYKKIDFRF